MNPLCKEQKKIIKMKRKFFLTMWMIVAMISASLKLKASTSIPVKIPEKLKMS